MSSSATCLRAAAPSLPQRRHSFSPLSCTQPLSPKFTSNNTLSLLHRRRHLTLRVRAIDAGQLCDYETKLSAPFESQCKLKIAIIGFGNFGQFLAKALMRQGHSVFAHSRSDHSDIARKLRVAFSRDPHDLCKEHPEVILLCSSIISTENVIKSLPLQRPKRNTLFVDVLSVKEFARKLLVELLPDDLDIICAHPMFGPECAKHGWTGLFFVYDKVRIGNEDSRIQRCNKFLDIFIKEGCNMVEMSCTEHDKYAAESQFIIHTIGRVLGKLNLESTPINTKGYEKLLDLVGNTAGDGFDLYYGLFMYNKNALEMLERLDLAFEALKKQLFGRLHDVVRKQLFGRSVKVPVSWEKYTVQMPFQNGTTTSGSISPYVKVPVSQKEYVVHKPSQNSMATSQFIGSSVNVPISQEKHVVHKLSRKGIATSRSMGSSMKVPILQEKYMVHKPFQNDMATKQSIGYISMRLDFFVFGWCKQ